MIYPLLTFSPSGTVSCWAWIAGPSSGSPRTAHHCSPCLGTTETSLCSWSEHIKCCRHVLIGFSQNHLCCSIVQKIPWCQFTLQMTEISTRFLEIFLGWTRPLLTCYIFGKILMRWNFYKPIWHIITNEINNCLSISHIQSQPLTMETSGPCISLAMTIVTWTRAVITIRCMMFHVTIVSISHQSQC